VEETIEILAGLKSKYEEHHNVTYTPEALTAAAKFSARYISDRYLPDKAIDVIDETGSRVRMRKRGIAAKNKENRELAKETQLESSALPDIRGIHSLILESHQIRGEMQGRDSDESRTAALPKRFLVAEEDIAEVVSKWTGIPISKLEETESAKLLRMEDALREHVIGQDPAIVALVRAVRRSRAGLKAPTKPIGSFIFMGPTGVGKSYLAHILAEYLFGEEDAIIRIDMSEFMEKFAVSRLVGAPPGYVGYQEGGELTEKVRRRPYSVILLDEIEKAHPDVFNILLQVLDNGRLTDNLGHTVDFRNTILIMTSNAGGRSIAKGSSLGFGHADVDSNYENMRTKVMSELKRVFNPEFLNRIDEVIVFNSLGREHIAKITELMLEEVKEQLRENGIELVVLPEAMDFIFEKGYDPHFGARHLRREIQRHIEDPIAEKLLDGSAVDNTIYVSYDGEKLNFSTVEPAACVVSDG
jgi:ATP-dependent Clp protease ATP-binding subunit ClpC